MEHGYRLTKPVRKWFASLEKCDRLRIVEAIIRRVLKPRRAKPARR